MSDTIVVIPNFNHAKYLSEAIDSALNQTYKCDIVVVDDGSTDNSKEVIAQYGEMIFSILKDNRGPGHTRNIGINFALSKKYDYIQLLDADDFMYSTKVEKLRKILDEHKEVGVVYDDYNLLLHSLQNDVTAREYKRSCTPETLWADNLIHCNSLVRASVFKNCQLVEGVYFDETMRVAQDYDFWLRATTKFIAWHHPECLSIVREGINNSAAPIQGDIRKQCMDKLRLRNSGAYL